MEILKLNDQNQITIIPECLAIKEFHDLYANDRSESKSKFIRQMSFVWLFSDFASPYVKQGLSDEDKWDIISKDLSMNRVEDKKMISSAIKRYKELNSTETLRLLEAAQSAINSIINYFNELDMSEKNEKGLLLNNISQVMTSLKGIGQVNKDIKKLKEEVLAEMNQSGRIKGGEQKGLFEDPE